MMIRARAIASPPWIRALAMWMGLMLGLPPLAFARASEIEYAPGGETMAPSTRALDLNREGQTKFDAGDYPGAAATWARGLEVLPENEVNRDERLNFLLITLETYRQAAEARIPAGQPGLRDAVDLLRRAIIVLDTYTMTLERAYGDGTALHPDADRSAQEIRELLQDTEAKLQPEEKAPRTQNPKPPVDVPAFNPAQTERRRSGAGLIVAGSITAAAGLGTISMIVVGAVGARRARRDFDRASALQQQGEITDRERETRQIDANARGRRGTALIISGAVLTGVLLAAGCTMLGIGIHRRIRYMAVAPEVGPRYAGIGLKTRF